jgi:hypothetical protein
MIKLIILFIFILIVSENFVYSYVKCDQYSACPDRFQCCLKINGSYGCCLITDKCSSDGEYCLTGNNYFLKENSFQLTNNTVLLEKQKQYKNDRMCKDEAFSLLDNLKSILSNYYDQDRTKESFIRILNISVDSLKNCEDNKWLLLVNQYLEKLYDKQLNDEFLNNLEKFFLNMEKQ